MEHLRTSELVPESAIPYTVVHPSCQVLVSAGADLTKIHLRLLAEAGVTDVYLLDKYDSILRLLAVARNELVRTADLVPGDRIAYPIFTPAGKKLVGWDTPVGPELVAELEAAGTHTVTIRKRGGLDEPSYRRFRDAIAPIESLYELPAEGLAGIERIRPGETPEERLEGETRGAGGWRDPRDGSAAPFADSVDPRPEATRTALRKEAWLDLFERAILQMRGVQARLAAGRRTDALELYPLATRLMNAYRLDRHLLLALTSRHPGRQEAQGWLEAHAVRVAVQAINIAAEQGYPFHAVLEIAYGALLADAGMLLVPEAVRRKAGALTPEETHLVRYHPLAGLQVLGRIDRLPASTPVVVYQAHERMDGTGYPSGVSGSAIHPYARIVGAADVYQALAAPRPHRGRAHPERALEAVRRLAEAGKICDGVYRALAASLSRIPVGSWVRLADGRLARIVSPGSDPRRPRARVLDSAEGAPADLDHARSIEAEEESRLALPALAGF